MLAVIWFYLIVAFMLFMFSVVLLVVNSVGWVILLFMNLVAL